MTPQHPYLMIDSVPHADGSMIAAAINSGKITYFVGGGTKTSAQSCKITMYWKAS